MYTLAVCFFVFCFLIFVKASLCTLYLLNNVITGNGFWENMEKVYHTITAFPFVVFNYGRDNYFDIKHVGLSLVKSQGKGLQVTCNESFRAMTCYSKNLITDIRIVE